MRNLNLVQRALLISAAALWSASNASPTTNSKKKTCTNYKIPVSITSTDLVFQPALEFKNNYDVADFATIAGSRDDAARDQVINRTQTTSGSYTIGATFCTPADGQPSSHKDTVLVATHGGLFDRT